MAGTGRLQGLYERIHACHECPRMDRRKVVRNARGVWPQSDVFLVSQALAQGTQRLTGISFFGPNAKLGNTGRRLEAFLNLFARTLYPATAIPLPSGSTVPARDVRYLPVYNTEVAQCFPGQIAPGVDRAPTTIELKTCVGQGFLEEELTIVKPRLVLLMGAKSFEAFSTLVLRERPSGASLLSQIDAIVKAGKVPSANVYGRKIFIAPICHASGANPHFAKMITSTRYVALLARTLK
jgi:uracil-DNA glycosylase